MECGNIICSAQTRRRLALSILCRRREVRVASVECDEGMRFWCSSINVGLNSRIVTTPTTCSRPLVMTDCVDNGLVRVRRVTALLLDV